MNHNIILENSQFRLCIGSDCVAKSLIHKSTGEECLQPGAEMPLFALTEPRPYNNEIKLAHPNKRTTFQANRVRREGNKLIVGFEIILHEAVVEIKETPDYISFRLVKFLLNPGDTQFHLYLAAVPAESFRLLQLPVKNRKYFGQWLNVVWDDAVAVNVMATAPYAIVDAEERKGYRILTAEAQRGVKMTGTEAALIVTDGSRLLDAIDHLEKDYNLPRGVESRRSKEIRKSWYWSVDVNPKNVDAHIAYCKKMGYQMMAVYYAAIFNFGFDRCGDYDECDFCAAYPNGYDSLREVLQKIRDAGIIPGLHFLHPHIGLRSRYVTPVADHRLHKLRYFTLAKPLDLDATTVYVEENPEDSVMEEEERCRVLQFGGELISYEGFSTEWPYCFKGCKRGYLDTHATEHPLGQIGGLLDVSEYCAVSCYLDQNSSIQDEVSAKLAKIYNLGFAFIYFDGSEGTNEPFAFHVPNGQYRTYKLMEPAPLLAEGAAKSHFSWHMLTGGNAFDVFTPDVFKKMIREHPSAEAVRMKQDFTRLNFGWWGSYGPELQPDHWEYGNLLAASWDCPATVQASLDRFAQHPRVDDLLEVLRRWEDVRINGWLTEAQKQEIHESEEQERILLINEEKAYELVPYDQIKTADEKLRAFAFTRQGRSYVVYWHTHGEATLKLPVSVAVQEELYLQAETTDTLPVSCRRYASADLPLEELAALFASAELEG